MANHKRPDFNLIMPIEYGEGDAKRTRYVRFGALWAIKDGDGYSGKVDFWPVGGTDRVMMMPPRDDHNGDQTDDHGGAD